MFISFVKLAEVLMSHSKLRMPVFWYVNICHMLHNTEKTERKTIKLE